MTEQGCERDNNADEDSFQDMLTFSPYALPESSQIPHHAYNKQKGAVPVVYVVAVAVTTS